MGRESVTDEQIDRMLEEDVFGLKLVLSQIRQAEHRSAIANPKEALKQTFASVLTHYSLKKEKDKRDSLYRDMEKNMQKIRNSREMDFYVNSLWAGNLDAFDRKKPEELGAFLLREVMEKKPMDLFRKNSMLRSITENHNYMCRDTYAGSGKRAAFELKAERMTNSSLAMAILLEKGYSVRDILSPLEMIPEREKAGKEALEHLYSDSTAENGKWIAARFAAGIRKLVEENEHYIYEAMKKGDKGALEYAGLLNPMSTYVVDMGQELERLKKADPSVIDDAEYERLMSQQQMIQAFDMPYDRYASAVTEAADRIRGNAEPEKLAFSLSSAMLWGCRAYLQNRDFAEAKLDPATKRFCDITDATELTGKAENVFQMLSFKLATENRFEAMCAERNPERMTKALESMMSGEFFEKMKIQEVDGQFFCRDVKSVLDEVAPGNGPAAANDWEIIDHISM